MWDFREQIMVDQGFIPPKETKISFSLEPAYNGLCSLILLSDEASGTSKWVEQTAAALSPEQLKVNQMLCMLASAFLGGATWPSFPAWMDDLTARDPYGLRDQIVDHSLNFAVAHCGVDRSELPDREQLLADREFYLAFCERIAQCKGEEHCGEEAEAYFALFQDPPVLQTQIIDHLRMMWDEHLAEEWEHNLPMLHDSVAAFESLDLSGLTTAEAIRRIIRRDEPDAWKGWRDDLDHIIFIPSQHIGPYLILIDQTPTTARVVFGARIPEGTAIRSPALNRSDLFVRLSALADDSRLRILELIAQEGELGAKDIMERLDLSKSAASRHLLQLTANGYLIVRQQDVSKYYSLNPHRIDETWQALRTFLQL
jgi:DNA-binding transcriptional ArsR family regulator